MEALAFKNPSNAISFPKAFAAFDSYSHGNMTFTVMINDKIVIQTIVMVTVTSVVTIFNVALPFP